ncbi:MAG: anthranilate synthase component I family protein, partial [Candidatus Binatia bacterium]
EATQNGEPTLTPWRLFAQHAGRPGAFFLDRASASTPVGGARASGVCRPGPSFAGSGPISQLLVEENGEAWECRAGRWSRLPGHPVDAIADYVQRWEGTPVHSSDLDPSAVVWPRTVGFLSYELGSYIEAVPRAPDKGPGCPLALLNSYDQVDLWDDARGRTFSVRFTNCGEMSRPIPDRLAGRGTVHSPCSSDPRWDYARYERGYRRIEQAIEDGEIYQANLSRRISFPLEGAPVELYARMRRRQPVPQGAFIDAGSFQVLSNSPECFLLVNGDRVSTFPIKGTRPRESDRGRDAQAVRALRADPKELAEHLMIVDLERNDLGRVSVTGSVEVPTYAEVVTFSTLHHLVSEIRGILRPDADLGTILRACFPSGSITGAPRIKAMEIIAEVENAARGVYTGAIGCFNGPRSFELNVAIRTAFCRDGFVHYWSGGGVVADSTLEAEYEETLTKARAFREALMIPVTAARDPAI